jgi:hypothetical protein
MLVSERRQGGRKPTNLGAILLLLGEESVTGEESFAEYALLVFAYVCIYLSILYSKKFNNFHFF